MGGPENGLKLQTIESRLLAPLSQDLIRGQASAKTSMSSSRELEQKFVELPLAQMGPQTWDNTPGRGGMGGQSRRDQVNVERRSVYLFTYAPDKGTMQTHGPRLYLTGPDPTRPDCGLCPRGQAQKSCGPGTNDPKAPEHLPGNRRMTK